MFRASPKEKATPGPSSAVKDDLFGLVTVPAAQRPRVVGKVPACEGAVLVVDASQGIQAQTLANVYLAMEQDLTIIPVLNKVDLPAADVPRVFQAGDQFTGL